MDFRGFLNSDRKPTRSKGQTQGSPTDAGKRVEDKELPDQIPAVAEKKRSKATLQSVSKKYSGRDSYLAYSDPAHYMSGISLDDEKPPDAASEKELGNEYYKQKKFKEAIDCYSRSIALSPSAVAFANRAMAYLKVKRYQEAEDDCSEALNLDDRYVKAYSRRATARKELGKIKSAFEDIELAVSIEPNTPELRKQYTEMRVMYDKESSAKLNGAISIASKGPGSKTQPTDKKGSIEVVGEPLGFTGSNSSGASYMKHHVGNNNNELRGSMQDLANRAASIVKAATEKNIAVPKSAYQFEVSWRALSDDQCRQAQLLKEIEPPMLPQIFKNALSAPMLIDIVRCTASFFKEDTRLAVSILENLATVPRFDMIVMCLSSVDRSDLRRMWEEVFANPYVASDQHEILKQLQKKYCCGGWQSSNLLQEELFPVR